MDNEKKTLLSIRNLKTYFVMDEGTSQAVDGVSFDVREGQVVGVVGESGCGKSVTIKSVLRIVQKPGRIIDGEILWWRHLDGGQEELIDLAQLRSTGQTNAFHPRRRNRPRFRRSQWPPSARCTPLAAS